LGIIYKELTTGDIIVPRQSRKLSKIRIYHIIYAPGEGEKRYICINQDEINKIGDELFCDKIFLKEKEFTIFYRILL